VDGSEIREPDSDRVWALRERSPRAADEPRFELVQTAGARGAAPLGASGTLPVRWALGNQEHGWSLSAFAPGAEHELLRWAVVDIRTRTPWLVTARGLLRGPGVGGVSFASDGNPYRPSALLLEPAHLGGHRGGLLLAEVAVALPFALLAFRRLRRTRASSARTIAWTTLVLGLGPLGLLLLLALEPAPRRAGRSEVEPAWEAAYG
jgi:hypothetical protein